MRLLPGLLSALAVQTVQAAQTGHHPVPTRTIIDILSSSPEFSEILHLVQQRGLVPFINQQWNSTFLAPVNSAFIGVDKDSISSDQILYHFINSTVYSADISSSTGLYYTYLDNCHAPISLSLHEGVNGKTGFDDVDLLASPHRGLVHSVLGLVGVPASLEDTLYMDPDYEAFASLVNFSEQDLNGSLLLAPSTEALKSWLAESSDASTTDPLLRYLDTPFGKDDRAKLVQRHSSANAVRTLYGGPAHKQPWQLELADGSLAELYENHTLVGPGYAAEAKTPLLVARDGLFVGIGSVAATESRAFLDLVPEKVILGLGGHSLVRGLSLYGHSDLIDGSVPDDKPRTIVVPVSHRYSDIVRLNDPEEELENPGSMIMYQFLDGVLPRRKHSMLIDSQMSLKSGKYPQRVHFERRALGDPSLNWELLDSTVYRLGNTSFYTAHDLLTPPPSLAMALGPMLVSSYSLTFLDKLNRLQLPHENSWTVLVPNREAWERNILLKYYLDRNEKALERLFDNLILKAPIYSDDTKPLVVEQFGGLETKVVWNKTLGEIGLYNSAIQSRLSTEVTDALFNNGVAHVVADIPMPDDLEVSTVDLIESGGRSLFLDLLRAADMQEVLEPAANFTILVPPSKDLRKNNYTVDTDPKKLRTMLQLHLLPGNPLRSLFQGGQAMTLAGEQLEAQSIGSSKLFGLTPVSAFDGQRVLLYQYGFTNGIVASGSSVVFTDRHISPQWIIPVKFGLRKGTYTIFGVLLGIFMASILVFSLIIWVSRNREEPVLIDEEAAQYRDESDAEDAPEASSTAPIETPGVSEERAFGRHLDLPT